MPTITLDDLRASIEQKYEPLIIGLPDGTQVTLTQALRLPSSKRSQIREIQDRISTEGVTEEQLLEGCHGIIRAAATDPKAADKLLKSVGDDLATIQEILQEYGKASQVGEASSSPS